MHARLHPCTTLPMPELIHEKRMGESQLRPQKNLHILRHPHPVSAAIVRKTHQKKKMMMMDVCHVEIAQTSCSTDHHGCSLPGLGRLSQHLQVIWKQMPE